jgi:hypothetical protein
MKPGRVAFIAGVAALTLGVASPVRAADFLGPAPYLCFDNAAILGCNDTQDTEGNLWYFGEDTVAFDFDECDHPDGLGGCTDGSWEAGLDVAGVGSIAEEGCLMIKEWAPLDPGSVEHKYYCEDRGLVLVEENAGGKTLWVDLIDVGATP